MKRILLTSSRGNATLELIRLLARDGHTIYLAETFKEAIGNYSKYAKHVTIVSQPRFNEEKYIDELITLIKQQHIDWLIPTYEETFYIAKYLNRLNQFCEVYCSNYQDLIDLHNKWRFSQMVDHVAVHSPETHLLQCNDDLKLYKPTSKQWVFKPIFSRFAAHTFICPEASELKDIDFAKGHWVAQKFIAGSEICSYNIAFNGKLTLHSTYQNCYRAGKGAGIYFIAVRNAKILDFVKTFVEQINFTGQISFDFIVTDDNEVYVIECNPRITSGIHLFRGESGIADCFSSKVVDIRVPRYPKPYMLLIAMLLYGFKQVLQKKVSLRTFCRDIKNADCVIYHPDDKAPFFNIIKSLYAFYRLSRKKRITLLEATTYDIEWNG